MEKCLELLNKMAAPLRFASQDSYKHLPLIKDMERTMKNFVEKLNCGITGACFPEDGKIALTDLIKILGETFASFDLLAIDEKKQRIDKALSAIDEINRLIEPVVNPAADSDERRLPQDVRLSFARLSLPVGTIKGVGSKTAQLLERKGLLTIEDLIYFLPRRYEDRRFPVEIANARIGFRETLIGQVILAEIKRYGKRPVFEVTVTDKTGVLKAKWFKGNPAYLREIFKTGVRVIFTGEIVQYNFKKEIVHPDFEILDDESGDLLHFKRIVPVYSETEGLYQKNLRRIMKRAVDDYASYVLSPIPADICRDNRLIDIVEAVRQAHFPASDQNLEDYNSGQTDAHRRLVFDEFFFFQLGMAMKKKGRSIEPGIPFKTGGPKLEGFYKMLPFSLTAAQMRVIEEIEGDMGRPSPMNRLLQGDVGCGKTVVAMAAMITAGENGYQAALMAPTEILAEQHYNNIRKWAAELSISAVILTGRRNAERKDVYEQIKNGHADIIIGTHALIQEEVTFNKLGLAVIDEQHRFGVVQRALLRGKGLSPDILVMTATPIPRTLAMTVYGDLDVSVIDELPPGKKPVRTKVYYEGRRGKVYEQIRNEINKGHQAFIVYPLVEESEHLDMKDATGMAEHLQKEIFPDCKVGLVHGKMKGTEKEETMAAFAAKKIDILVATTVIEVGIDIPSASLMVIEHAERFGLSQLHQLRGRVGRSDIPSACILLARAAGSEDARKRLRVMERSNDGFVVAEEDLVLRGPGEFMGTRQSGLPDFRIANIIRDGKILNEAKKSAFDLVAEDPLLEKPQHRMLKDVLMKRWEGRLELAKTC